MKVVILCGGRGTRLREETDVKPKPMVVIGERPILWHIMKLYSYYGLNDFVLCLGYKGEQIKQYFINHEWMSNDCILDCGEDKQSRLRLLHQPEEWKITFADTGADTPTGGRIKIVEKYIDGDEFLLTYGDGVSDVDIRAVIELHKKKGKIGTLTGIHPASPFGIIEMEDNIAKSFKEKPRLDGIINGGFFVFKKKFFDYLSEDSVLEEVPLRKLSAERQLAVYEHSGFWACVDTFKDVERLKGMWNNGERPWTVWEQNKT